MKNLVSVFLSLVLLCGPASAQWAGVLSGSPSSSIPAGISGWWKFNDGTGLSATDSSGNGNTGTLTGGATWVSGTGPLALDGVNGYVAIPNQANFRFERTDAFSLTIWAKWNGSASGQIALIEKFQPTGNQPGYQLSIDADNARARVFITQADGNGVGTVTASNSLPADGQLHLVVFTYDGSSNGSGLKCYIDDQAAVAASGTLTQSILNTTPLLIGTENNTRYFWGELDDARVYTRELSAVEVGQLYSAGPQ